MGTLNFLLPPDLGGTLGAEMERACVAGGQDHMPFATLATFLNGRLALTRSVQESGFLQVPWEVAGLGRLLFSSATLMERQAPYHLALELARGKTNRLRCQASDWVRDGLAMNSELADHIHQATLSFGQTLLKSTPGEIAQQSQDALQRSCQAAEELVAAYTQQVFQVRHMRQARLESYLGCRLNGLPQRTDLQKLVPLAFNAVGINVPWKVIEPNEGDLRWQALDDVVNWTQGKGLTITLGPLIDFSGFGIPDWIWAKNANLTRVSDYLGAYVDRVIRRYKGKINIWQLTAGSNVAGVFAQGEEELLWLTMRLLEFARRVDAGLDLIVGVAQPWGDYLALREHRHSPFAFVDTLLRTGIKLGALDVEIIMGPTPRGSYCRDTLDASRILDLYSFLGVPVQVTLGYPSATTADPLADPDLKLAGGFWHGGFTPPCQADWATLFASLALCKPGVRGVMWTHLNDSTPHQFPHTGLVDTTGNLKPALERLFALRSEHLK